MENWCIITTYKNNFELFGTFVNFYSKYWGIVKFYLIIGISKNDKDKIQKNIDFLSKKLQVDIECFFYETTDISKISDLSFYKHKYFKELFSYIPNNYNRFLNIDNDEFYYHNDISSLKLLKKLHFHFVEFIPHSSFSLNTDFQWSMQGWYYRVNFFKIGNPKQIKEYIFPDELQILCNDINRSTHFMTHQWCKEVYFEREQLNIPWAHKNNGTFCDNLRLMDSTKEQHSFLANNFFCYHIGILDYNFFKNKKTKWLNAKTGKYYMQVGEITTNYEDYFSTFYKHPISNNLFTDNFLKKYWIETDF